VKASAIRQLHYTIAGEPSSFSVSPFDSDALTNALVMEQIVGTLLKYGGAGRYEPYLAEEWSSSNNGKVWHFKIRENVHDESGTEIDAPAYVESIKRILLKLGKKDKDLPAFSKLNGWDEFVISHKHLRGISAISKHVVEFSFENKPEGFLEYLAMPYFGYFSPEDFAPGSTDWRSNKKITSSGPFRIAEISDDQVTLELRKEWPLKSGMCPSSVKIEFSDFEGAKNRDYAFHIIQRDLTSSDTWPSSYVPVLGTPTLLTTIVLSPFIENVFNDAHNRAAFFSKAHKELSLNPMKSPSSRMAEGFYNSIPFDKKHDSFSPNKEFESGVKKKVSVLLQSFLTIEEKIYLKKFFTAVFKGSSITPDFIDQNRNEPDWLKKSLSNRHYDIRIAGVDIGGNLENWAIRMMFCSSLGVSFPDGSGKMCDLVSRYEKDLVKEEEYQQAFNQTLLDEKSVIPLWHSGLTWLFSKNIKLSNISPSMSLPRFEQINLE
jgi:ABC-type transport system substrate-binding protein